jgi:hypothetical protein
VPRYFFLLAAPVAPPPLFTAELTFVPERASLLVSEAAVDAVFLFAFTAFLVPTSGTPA